MVMVSEIYHQYKKKFRVFPSSAFQQLNPRLCKLYLPGFV